MYDIFDMWCFYYLKFVFYIVFYCMYGLSLLVGKYKNVGFCFVSVICLVCLMNKSFGIVWNFVMNDEIYIGNIEFLGSDISGN